MVRHNRTAHGSSRAAHPEPVARITDAPAPLSDDLAQRTRRYLVQMSIRVVCFLGAVVLDHWTRWLLLVGAVLLPYFAVLLANATRGARTTDPDYLRPREIGSGPDAERPDDHEGPGGRR